MTLRAPSRGHRLGTDRIAWARRADLRCRRAGTLCWRTIARNAARGAHTSCEVPTITKPAHKAPEGHCRRKLKLLLHLRRRANHTFRGVTRRARRLVEKNPAP